MEEEHSLFKLDELTWNETAILQKGKRLFETLF